MFLDQERFHVGHSAGNGEKSVGDGSVDVNLLNLSRNFCIPNVDDQRAAAVARADVLQGDSPAVV